MIWNDDLYTVWINTVFLSNIMRHLRNEYYYLIRSVAVAWSVESLPSNPAARVRFPAGSGILISVLDWVCDLCLVSCPVLSSAESLTLCWPHIQGGPPLCICLVFWSRDCCSPYRHLTHRHLAFKFLGVYILDWGRVNKRRRLVNYGK